MLTRAARRRQTLRHVQYAADKIQLPWLCPAISSPHTTTASQHRPIKQRTTTPRPRPSALLSTHARQLASAAPLPDVFSNRDAYNPYGYQNSDASISQKPALVSSTSQVDLSKILMIDQTTAPSAERLDTNRTIGYDIRGTALDIEATLDACLQTRMWSRAEAILGQLRILYQAHPDKLVAAHNRVLEAMIHDYIWHRNTENTSRINQWVEKFMKKNGIEPNAQTFALKIKAALATLEGKKRDRTVRRYWKMAKDNDVDWEVASLRDILSDSDLGKLSEIMPLEANEEWHTESMDGLDIATVEDVVSTPALINVRETDQKGLGLVSLRRSLSLFSDAQHLDEWEHVKHADETTRNAYARQRQVRLEQDSLSSALDRWRTENEKMAKLGLNASLSHARMGSMLWKWHELLSVKIEEELELVAQAEAKPRKNDEDRIRCEHGPFLRLLTSEQLAALTAMSAVQVMTKNGVKNPMKLARFVTTVGRVIEQEVKEQTVRQRDALRKTKLSKQRQRDKLASQASEKSEPETEVREDGPGFMLQRKHWTSAIHGKVGAVVCGLLFDIAEVLVSKSTDGGKKVTMLQPAFERRTVFEKGRRVGVVILNPELIEMLSSEPVADLIAKQLPMISLPRPWTGFEEGGFLQSHSEVLRVKFGDQVQRDYAQAAANRGDLDELFAGLDILGKTGWRINQDVYKVMLDAWNSGEAVANLPPLEKGAPDVETPGPEASVKERFTHHLRMRKITNELRGIHSNRCFQNFQMEIAKAFQKETFYLPHNVDFRGRAYPMPPYLNQMGADNARGLLLFEQGKKLGSHGLHWLKVHLANVCGYDKASLTDRARFADDHIEDMRDAVSNPLNGKRWWLKAEDPWQCLATCHELTRAIDSGDPESFVSYLPIHQDGTCNGLQHYAALGGDIAGAKQVNLEPGDKPADVYTGVAELVKAEISKDAKEGLDIAKILDGRVTRKIVKQTVMTNVYGVTFSGAMAQVRRQLEDFLPELNSQGRIGEAAVYIARKIFKSLGSLFEGAHDIQYWFGDCANRITSSISPAQLEELEARENGTRKVVAPLTKKKAVIIRRKQKKNHEHLVTAADFRSTVIWTTPLKLPVVQPYRTRQSHQVKTRMASVHLSDVNATDCVDKRKQLQAFPPNFIHSLDATHMMLSALRANECGLTFSAVHDSFWTHAADIDVLNDLLRDAFIRMHTEDVVGRLAAEFQMRYKGHLYLAKIGPNNKLAKALAKYRESSHLCDPNNEMKAHKTLAADREKRRQFIELRREHERQKLLASSDPAEQEQGRKMITAASIFEQYNGEKYLNSKSSLGETALGKIPEADTAAIEEALKHGAEKSHDIDIGKTLEPLLEHEELHADKSHGDNHELNTSLPTKNPAGFMHNQSVWLWLPLTFKPVPKKGDWNVERLRKSTYFFS